MSEKRACYRNPVNSVGYLLAKEGEKSFVVVDRSLGGIQVYFDQDPELQLDETVTVKLPLLELESVAFPLWTRKDQENGVYAGLRLSIWDGIELSLLG